MLGSFRQHLQALGWTVKVTINDSDLSDDDC